MSTIKTNTLENLAGTKSVSIEDLYNKDVKLFKAEGLADATPQDAQLDHQINWDTPSIHDTDTYEWNSGTPDDIKILKQGIYRITYTATYENTGLGRATIRGAVRTDGTQSFGSNSTTYSRGAAYDSGMALHSVLVTELIVNRVIDVRVLLDAADQTDPINKVPTYTMLIIELIKYT